MERYTRLTLTLFIFTIAAISSHASDQPGEVTIYRDTWGVPHIFAATDADAAYGLGYAQAEDRLADIYTNVRTATGRMAEAFGPRFVQQDYAMRLVKNAELCEKHFDTIPTELQEIGESFMRGVRKYAEEHPEKVPDHAVELYGWHTLAMGRAILLNWPLGTIQDDLRNRDNSVGFGSNQWAVAPKRSADGRAILLTDPHLTWEGLAVFTEAHVTGDKLDMHGFFLAGVPVVVLGHNTHVGWAATTGGPDTSDVYMVKIDNGLVPKYEYNGEWHSAKVELLTIPVKDAEPVKQPAAYTKLGPLFAEPDRKNKVAYVGASPYLDEAGAFEQFYAMVLAKNADEFYRALAMNQYMEQNIMYADRGGNIGYVRTGRVPIRPDGHNWSAPVPAVDSSTEWKGIHPVDDLVQLLNPPQGYMQNCNISPAMMLKDSPMTPDKYKDYIYNVSWDDTNSRGDRALQLLDGDSSVTKAEAMAYAFDVYDVRAPYWKAALAAAVENGERKRLNDERFAEVVQAIAKWDGNYSVDTEVGPVMKHWYAAARSSVDIDALIAGAPLEKAQQTALLDALQAALETMKELYGSKAVTWGDINRHGRNGELVPMPGSDFGSSGNGSRTLLTVGVRDDVDRPGYYVSRRGSMSMMLMFFDEDGVEAHSAVMWGQSSDPKSKHHMDQGRELFSKRKFKPAWTTRKDLEGHIESTKVLKTS